MNKKTHWEKVYLEKDMSRVSWYQPNESLSFNLILKYSNPQSKVIDVGCGASYLVDNLLQKEYKNISLLDISCKALEITKDRVGDKVKYFCQSMLDFTETDFEIWHDRAVLHFLTKKDDYQKYAQVLAQSIKTNGIAIIATFAPDKVRKCSDLNTKAYDKDAILQLFGDEFVLLEFLQESHPTPNNDKQLFNYFCLQKT